MICGIPKLEKQIAVLERRPDIGMVITDVAHIDRDGQEMGIIGAGYRPSERFARLFVRGMSRRRRCRDSPVGSPGDRRVYETFLSAGLDDHEL